MKVAHEMTTPGPLTEALDVNKIRKDFPILKQKVHGKPLVYLDNGATSQKPQIVIDTLNRYYTAENSNIHRGVHFLSEQATAAYESGAAQDPAIRQCTERARNHFRPGHHRGH